MQMQQLIPLNKLFLSPLNQRQTQEGDDVSDLLPLVRAQGVLQRLVVVKATAQEKKKYKADFGVVAGGRRLVCLKTLAREKAIKPTEKIDCLLIPASAGIAASIAENSARKNLHPVDELRAFKALVESGTTIEEVAATFGVTPKVVERRLRLTTVSPKLLDEYRADHIQLDQLMALALSDDHAAQEAAWFDGPSWDRTPSALRRALIQDEPNADTDRRVRFVGLDAYKAAGGRLRTDLFSDGAGYILDVTLLDQLARDKLHERAQGVQADGWQTVHVSAAAQGVNVNLECSRIQPSHREPTKKEAKAQAKLEAALQKIDEQLQAETEEESEIDYDALEEERTTLYDKIEQMESEREVYTAEQKAAAGVVLSLDSDGNVRADYGVVPRSAGTRQNGGGDGINLDRPRPGKGERPAHSERLMSQLSAHRSAAMQAVIAASPRFALVGLLTTMVPGLFDCDASETGLRITLTDTLDSLKDKADDLPFSKAVVQLSELRTAWEARLAECTRQEHADEASGHDTERDPLIDWLMSQETETLLSLLAFCVASTVDVTTLREGDRPAQAFATAIGLNMADWWTATAGSYFKHVAKPVISAALNDAKATPPAGAGTLKKDALASAAETAIAGKGWLPLPLRAA